MTQQQSVTFEIGICNALCPKCGATLNSGAGPTGAGKALDGPCVCFSCAAFLRYTEERFQILSVAEFDALELGTKHQLMEMRQQLMLFKERYGPNRGRRRN